MNAQTTDPAIPPEDLAVQAVADDPESRPGGIPLYVWVIAAVVLAIPLGLLWGEGATSLEIMPRMILRALTALAAPLVVLAILSAIVTNDIHGR
jgi:DAACS family dicarboxylate/amino acid:cation (Na+ or H+) symporter